MGIDRNIEIKDTMEKYIEFREGLVDNRGQRANIIKLDDLPHVVNPMKDSYRSLFYYDESILKHVTDTGSVSGFRGKAGIDIVAFDMDNLDLNKARQDAVTLINTLIQKFNLTENEIGIFFSGRKGFSVEFKTAGIIGLGALLDENIPILVKKLAIEIAGPLGSFDRVIYNHNRLYRVAGTLHQKESEIEGKPIRLFKTSISFDTLKNSPIEDIQRYSSVLRASFPFDNVKNVVALSDTISKISQNLAEISNDPIVRTLPVINGLPDENLAPKGYKVCLWRLAQGTYTESRDNALLRIADHERKLGFPPEVVHGKLSGVLELMSRNNPQKAKLDPMNDQDIDRIVRQAFNNKYDFGCNDEILAQVCSRKCYLAPAVFKEEETSIGTPLEAYTRYKKFAHDYYSNIVPTGFKAIDGDMPFLVGTMTTVVGRPGSGKTSMILNLLKYANKINMPAVLFSVDMSEEMIIQKLASIMLTNVDGSPKYSSKEITELHARGDRNIMQAAEEAFHNLSKNVLISSKSSMSVDDIEGEIKSQEAKLGQKIKLVVVDFVQLLKSDYDPASPSAGSHNANKIRQLAKDMNLCIILLSQTGRQNGGEGDTPLGLASAKGSGAWEELSHNVITCWRPFSVKNIKHDWVMSLRMAKNRLGQAKTVDLFFHGPSGIMRDLEVGEEMILAGLREQLEHDE